MRYKEVKNFKNHKPVIYAEAKNDEPGTKIQNGLWKMDDMHWFCFWFRPGNYKNNQNHIHNPGIGDMNIVAVPNKNKQPDNLQKLKSYDDEWSDEAMKKFYKSKKLTII